MLPRCLPLLPLLLLPSCQASSILVVSAAGTPSHVGFYGEMAAVLANRGHQVTVISSHKMRKLHENMRHIFLDVEDIMKPVNNTLELRQWAKIQEVLEQHFRSCVQGLAAPEVRALEVAHFDLVISGVYFSECFLSLLDSSKMQAPLILFLPFPITNFVHELIGSINFPGLFPVVGMSFSYPMTFLERVGSTLVDVLSVWGTKSKNFPLAQKECEKAGLCPKDMASFYDIEKNASLVFLNSVESLTVPARPLPLNVVPVGGLNCRESQPLPQDLRLWADGTGDAGFVYFSLGTALKPSDFTEEMLSAFFNVFRRLDIPILWKYNGDHIPEDLPKNVKISKWLPQQDVLGHPKCSLFLSHGGLFSTMEATYHGVPMLALPVFGDQPSNAQRVKVEGWGEVLQWEELTEDALMKKMGILLNDEKYRKTAKRRSRLMKDQPMSSQERLVYWAEYVIRHKGAKHLRSPFHDLHWYQVYNADVWAVLILLIVTFTSVILLCARYFVRFLISKVKGCLNHVTQREKVKKN